MEEQCCHNQKSYKQNNRHVRPLISRESGHEKKTQEKVQKDKVQAQKAKKMKIEKNW